MGMNSNNAKPPGMTRFDTSIDFRTLAYVDNFWLVGIAVLVMIPFVFLMKKVKPGGPIAVH
ncbi:MAG: hypothetical protein ABR953_12605 [Candidatus Acidiferrales bacterium]|jgi:hypothetical protein